MIVITTIASSSAGNCYAVSDCITPLLIECGVSLARLRKRIGHRVSSMAACLVSHGHKDHCRFDCDIAVCGVTIYASQETLDASPELLEYYGHRCSAIAPGVTYPIGTWQVKPFECEHDFPGTLGFLLASGSERLVYMIDSAYPKYTFAGMTHLMIECNYSAELVKEAIRAGQTHPAQYARVARNHMSLERLLKWIRKQDLRNLQETHLLHLSDRHSDAELFEREVARATGRPVFVAGR